MNLIPGTIKNRNIFYIDIHDNLEALKTAKLKNWILFVIEDNKDNTILYPFAEMCIAKEVLYVCAAGKACSEIDDLFDEVMVLKEINGEKLSTWMITSEDVLMTSWHYNFEEGFWFAATTACYEELLIDTVLVANLTPTNYLPVIEELTDKIIKGWLPPD